MTWEIVLGIIALAGFMLSVITPIIKLNANITKLGCSIDALYDAVRKSDKRIDSHSERLDDHEIRITVLETKEEGRNHE